MAALSDAPAGSISLRCKHYEECAVLAMWHASLPALTSGLGSAIEIAAIARAAQILSEREIVSNAKHMVLERRMSLKSCAMIPSSAPGLHCCYEMRLKMQDTRSRVIECVLT